MDSSLGLFHLSFVFITLQKSMDEYKPGMLQSMVNNPNSIACCTYTHWFLLLDNKKEVEKILIRHMLCYYKR